MDQNNTEQVSIVNIAMVAVGILVAAVSVLTGTNMAQAEDDESGQTESVTESLATETQAIYIDANVLSDYASETTKVTGETVPDAEVTVTYPGDETFTAKADKNGEFILESLQALEDGDEVQVSSDKDGQTFEIFFNYKNS
ncbi:Ig-like domain-containing protein [Salinicoccus sp. HZC-1]|uniref:Ig-like domain-containing protein n=1 Tax=Salinicoccus sp. HZC-1 TaxID=3385497 RepID=UPI00398B9090